MSHHTADPGRPLARTLPTLLEVIARGAMLVRVSDARVLDVNAAFARMIGAEQDEVIDRSAVELGIWPAVEAVEQLAAELGNETTQVVLSPANAVEGGSIETVAQVLTCDGEAAIAFITLDPDDKSVAQRDLYVAEERFRRAFNEAPIGMALVEIRPPDVARYLQVNRAFCELTGYPAEQLVGMSAAEITHPDDVPEIMDTRPRMLSGEITTYATDKRYVRPDGEETWARVHVTLTRDSEGEPMHALTMAVDISDQKKAEEAELEHRRLEARLAQSQRLETVGQLAGGVAHDFNNLLAVILNYAYFVREQLPAGSTLRNDVEEIRQAAERASDLTHQLLVFSRQEAYKPEVLDLNAVVGEMERMLRRTIGEHLELVTELAPEPCPVSADRTQLEQVVMNLVVNARDAIPDGGTISVSTRRVEALVEGSGDAPDSLSPGPHVLLAVRDDGVGMEPDVLAHAFEPFFTTKPKGTGTGLGLATVYGTVTASGGEAEIESTPALGTTVRVWLPLVRTDADSGEGGEPGRPAGQESDRATILVVEDEDAVRRLTCRILEGGGFLCLAASSGDEALSVVEGSQSGIDLLLTDVVMPGMSGKELAERLGGDSGPPVLFMSGYTDDAIPYRDQPDRVRELLHKPFTAEALLRTVKKALADARRESVG